MTAMTLIEAAKIGTGDDKRDAIIEIYARATDIFGAIPFESINGNAYKYTQEATLSGVGFRGLNDTWTASNGVLNPQIETLAIAGGEIEVDVQIVKSMGMGARSTHEAMKIKNLAHQWTDTFIKGDSSTSPKQFDGLQVRLTGSQLISNSSGTGAALSLINLDATISQVYGANALIMSRKMRDRFTQAMRTTTVAGYVTFETNQFGQRVAFYNGLPILIADGLLDVNASLAFNEAAAGGGTASTSIYVVNFAPGMVCGLQNGTMDVDDFGKAPDKPVYRTRVEWLAGFGVFHPKAAARCYGITDAAIVA